MTTDEDSTSVKEGSQLAAGMAPQAAQAFVSFDGGVQARAVLQQPDRYRYWDNDVPPLPRISRGAGLSYAAASFRQGGLAVCHSSFDRVTGFDSSTKVVEVETGITLFMLHRFLSSRGLYLPVQPGHGRITVGGCIAADVHGKNHARDGTFMEQVESLTLFHPSYGMVELSRESEPDLFRLTCGGYGLTGHMIRARLRAVSIPSRSVELKATAFSNAISGLNKLRDAAQEADFSYTWHDMGTSESRFGSGYLYSACFSSEDHEPSLVSEASEPPSLSAADRAAWPIGLFNLLSTRIVNLVYRQQQRRALNGRTLSLTEALFPIHKTQLYFKLFGARGFHEYQAILPKEAMNSYLDAIHTYTRRRRIPVTLGSAKAFGGSRELLRFTGEGVCFALNFPRSDTSQGFMSFLDDRMVELGGIPNIIKDSRLPRKVIDACYPGAGAFRSMLHAYDPRRIFRSELSERLGL